MNQLSRNSFLQGGKYKIERVLGQGGFGITYLANHTILDRKVAIKEFFPKDYCDRNDTTSHVTVGTKSNVEFVGRLKAKFIKEARNISRLDHPSIVRIHDVFEEHDTAYYVMDYVEGESLAEMVKRRGSIPCNEAVDIILKVGAALDYVHSFKMNHLDVKPANIMMRRSDNKPILIDFGLAKQYDGDGNQTSTTPVGISHGYAPMEQYKRNGVVEFSPQTDVYSLGATLYKLLTGVTPPEAADLIDTPLHIPARQVPGGVGEVIVKAMSVGKTNRYQTINALCGALATASQSANAAAVPPVFNKGSVPTEPSADETVINGGDSTIFTSDSTVFTSDSTVIETTNHSGQGMSVPPPIQPLRGGTPAKPKKKGVNWELIIGTLVVIIALGCFIWAVCDHDHADSSSFNDDSSDWPEVEEIVDEVEEVPAEDDLSGGSYEIRFNSVTENFNTIDEDGNSGMDVCVKFDALGLEDEYIRVLVRIYEQNNTTNIKNYDGDNLVYYGDPVSLPYYNTTVSSVVFVPIDPLPYGELTYDVVVEDYNGGVLGRSSNHPFKVYVQS